MASSSTLCSSCLRAALRISMPSKQGLVRPSNFSRRAYAAATTRPRYNSHASSFTRLPKTPSTSSFIPSNYISSRRHLAATATATASSAPSDPKPARAILNPRKDASGNDMAIFFSPRAIQRLATIAATDSNPNLALRITIESGGCHGFQYLMDLADLSKTPPTEEDTVFEGEKGAKAIIDESSLELLSGSTVDYTMELIGSQFKVTGIPGATSSCGCGTSFDIQL